MKYYFFTEQKKKKNPEKIPDTSNHIENSETIAVNCSFLLCCKKFLWLL